MKIVFGDGVKKPEKNWKYLSNKIAAKAKL